MKIFLRYNKIAGKNSSLDRNFTSAILGKWCLKKLVSIVNTMRRDWKGIPREMKVLGNREEKSTKFYQGWFIWYVHKIFQKTNISCLVICTRTKWTIDTYSKDREMLLTSHVVEKASGKKNVIVLSTMYKVVRVANNQGKKPS